MSTQENTKQAAAAHTPGPWRVGDAGCTVFAPKGASPLRIACITINTVADERQRANARLIAAAPELLRELKSAIFYIETYGGEVTRSFSAGGNMERVKAVIAKATGGAL